MTASPARSALTQLAEDRVVSGIRLALALATLAIIYIDPTEPERFVAATFGLLLLQSVFSGALYVLTARRSRLRESFPKWAHWADMAFYLVLIALSTGTNSIFFFGLLFPIMAASFLRGHREGVRVALASAGAFFAIGLTSLPPQADLPWNRLLLRSTYLLVFGFALAYWGGAELVRKRRLALLKDLGTIFNPHFGVDRMIGSTIEKLRLFYHADESLLILRDVSHNEYRLWRASRDEPGIARVQRLPAMLSDAFSRLEDGRAVLHREGHAMDDRGAGLGRDTLQALEQLGNSLSATTLATAPLTSRGRTTGRILLTFHRAAHLDTGDLEFLMLVGEHILPALEHIQLVDRLASDAAEEERLRVARDLHDSLIQPYIGLQLGLAALRQRLDRPEADVSSDVDRLLEMTGSGLDSLRDCVSGLREEDRRRSSLEPAVRRFARKFSEATRIEVEVHAGPDFRVGGRVAAEAFQMVAEGLSNIRRHTQASRAKIRLSRPGDRFRLEIENDNPAADVPPFSPRSIRERAEALGGFAEVLRGQDHTTVAVEFPL